ncbi:MAG TPA: NrfD/PsrC family molybdoenzyme membrane anchor subunit [Gemmatimonadales bacterium]
MTALDQRQDVYQRGLSSPAGGFVTFGAVLAVLGLGFFVMVANGDDPDRAWRAFHVNFLFFSAMSMGAVIFAATQKVTKGVWAGPLLRIAQAGAAFMPISLVLFLVIFLIGRTHLFPWIAHPTPKRGIWLTSKFMFARDLVSLLIVYGLAIKFVLNDMKPDLAAIREQSTGWRRNLYDRIVGAYKGTPDDEQQNWHTVHRQAPLLIVLWGYLFSLLGFDLVMSLAPYWTSSLFGAFFFISGFLSGMTGTGLLMVYWRNRLNAQAVFGKQQFHDLGKLIFGFTVFWTYLMFAQFLVIWYGNLPDETSFLFLVTGGAWRPLSIVVGTMVFFVPFWGLIGVKPKTTPFTFALFCLISFAGIWLERYILVEPNLQQAGPTLGLPELGVTVGFLGLFLLSHGLFARAFPMVSARLSERSFAVHH